MDTNNILKNNKESKAVIDRLIASGDLGNITFKDHPTLGRIKEQHWVVDGHHYMTLTSLED